MKLLILTVLSLSVISKANLISSTVCETCLTFSDGCNDCTCNNETNLDIGCTRRVCVNGNVETPGCRTCRPGYVLNPNTYECETNSS